LEDRLSSYEHLSWEMRGVTPIPMMGLTMDERLPSQGKIRALRKGAKLPRYWREGAVEVRPFTAEKRLGASEAQGLSGEAMKRNPPTTVIPRVDESKIAPEELSEPAHPSVVVRIPAVTSKL
jgi:hypothetical protein